MQTKYKLQQNIVNAALYYLWQENGLVAKALAGSTILSQDYKAPIIEGFFEANQLYNPQQLNTVITKLERLIQENHQSPNIESTKLELSHLKLKDDDKQLTIHQVQQLLNLLKLKQNNQSFNNIADKYLEAIAIQYDDFKILNHSYGLAAIQTKSDSSETAYVYCNALRYSIDNKDQATVENLKLLNSLLSVMNNLYNNLDEDNNTQSSDEASLAWLNDLRQSEIFNNIDCLLQESTQLIKRWPIETIEHQLAKFIQEIANLLSTLSNSAACHPQSAKNSHDSEMRAQAIVHNLLNSHSLEQEAIIHRCFNTRPVSFAAQLEENDRLNSLCEQYLTNLSTVSSLADLNTQTKTELENKTAALNKLKTAIGANHDLFKEQVQLLHNALGKKAWQAYFKTPENAAFPLDKLLINLAKTANQNQTREFIQLAATNQNLDQFIQQAKKQAKTNALVENFLKAPQVLQSAATQLKIMDKKLLKMDKKIATLENTLAKQVKPSAKLQKALAAVQAAKLELNEQKIQLINNPFTVKATAKFSFNPIKLLAKTGFGQWISNRQRSSQFKKIALICLPPSPESPIQSQHSFSTILTKLHGQAPISHTQLQQGQVLQLYNHYHTPDFNDSQPALVAAKECQLPNQEMEEINLYNLGMRM